MLLPIVVGIATLVVLVLYVAGARKEGCRGMAIRFALGSVTAVMVMAFFTLFSFYLLEWIPAKEFKYVNFRYRIIKSPVAEYYMLISHTKYATWYEFNIENHEINPVLRTEEISLSDRGRGIKVIMGGHYKPLITEKDFPDGIKIIEVDDESPMISSWASTTSYPDWVYQILIPRWLIKSPTRICTTIYIPRSSSKKISLN